jgi:ATP-dependent Clp protease protease subunit
MVRKDDDNEDKEARVEQKLLKQRIVLLFEDIDEVSASEIVQSLITLDSINQQPIKLLINSVGGTVDDGLAIMDVMGAIKSQVHTFIVSTAMSMAAMVSICGSKRYIMPHGVWMQHATRVETKDYIRRAQDRLNWDAKQEQVLNDIITQRTKLTVDEIEKLNNGELWFDAKQTVQKGICDQIVTKFYKEKR